MLSAVVLLASALSAAAAPAIYDQRQDGDFNVRADVQNVVLLLALPSKMSVPTSVFDGIFKNLKPAGDSDVQERADVHVMEAFVEPSTPYKVEIGSSGRFADGDGRAVEVVIAGRKRQTDEENEGLKLLGAAEDCGPDRERDPDTLTCRPREEPAEPDTTKQPEIVPVLT